MNTIELKGAKLRYHQIGQGPVLIFIPGLMVLVISLCHLHNNLKIILQL